MPDLALGEDAAVVEAQRPVGLDGAPVGAAAVQHAPALAPRTFENAHAPTSNQMWMLPVPRAFSYSDSGVPGASQALPPSAPIICR